MVVAAAGKLLVTAGEVSPPFRLSQRLRRPGQPAVEAAGKQEKVFERATEIRSPCVIFIGEEELASGTFSLRSL